MLSPAACWSCWRELVSHRSARGLACSRAVIPLLPLTNGGNSNRVVSWPLADRAAIKKASDASHFGDTALPPTLLERIGGGGKPMCV